MKKNILSTIIAAACTMGAFAVESNGITVYINPGHGGHDSDDRNVVIEPYAPGDPEGYWESNSNLEKGLALRDILEAKGYKVVMSRTTNYTSDDLGLSTIVRLANSSNADIFFSIHSNATGTDARRNFPLMLFRGHDNEPVKPEDKVVSQILNKHLLENEVTYWTNKSPNVRGDFTFYPAWNNAGLGVLRGLTVTGMLSEGSFHDYIPEAYRLMNKDFCWLEAYHFRRTIDEYFNIPGEDKGHIFGRLNDTRSPRPGDYKMFGDDTFATIQTATVSLFDADGKLVDTYITETTNTNGVYGFKNLQPGTYTVKVASESHYPSETTVEVTADLVTYANFKLNKVRNTPPQVVSYSPVWNEGDEALLCNVPVTVDFNWDMDTELTAKAFSIEPAVEGTVTWEDLNYRLVFKPTKAYDTNTVYTVTISADAAHGGGATMAQPFSFKFKTTDRNFMEILGQFPKENENVHYANATIELRFDKKPNTTPILNMVSCKDESGNEVKFDKRGMKSSKVSDPYGYFRLPFASNLIPGKEYTVNISGELADRDGITIQNPLSIKFKAIDAGEEKSLALLDEMIDETVFSLDEEQAVNISEASVSSVNKKNALFEKAVNFNYTFSTTEGGEILWRKPVGTVPVTSGQKLGVHVNGDLSGNELYLLFSSDLGEKYVEVCKLDFLGWRYVEVPTNTFEGTQPYVFAGVKILQVPGQASVGGTVGIDRIHFSGQNSITETEIATVEIGPNPASEYLIANAGVIIESVTLINLNGLQIAQSQGNVLNVSSIADGH